MERENKTEKKDKTGQKGEKCRKKGKNESSTGMDDAERKRRRKCRLGKVK